MSTSKRPYRMIAEHHRSVWRFAVTRYRGVRRVLLVPLAPVLGVRCVAAMAPARAGGVRACRGSPASLVAPMGKSSRQQGRARYQSSEEGSRPGATPSGTPPAPSSSLGGGARRRRSSRSTSQATLGPLRVARRPLARRARRQRLRHVGAELGLAARQRHVVVGGRRRRPHRAGSGGLHLRRPPQPR